MERRGIYHIRRCAGVLAAAILLAISRGIEPGFGKPLVPLLLWAAVGAGAAYLSRHRSL